MYIIVSDVLPSHCWLNFNIYDYNYYFSEILIQFYLAVAYLLNNQFLEVLDTGTFQNKWNKDTFFYISF